MSPPRRSVAALGVVLSALSLAALAHTLRLERVQAPEAVSAPAAAELPAAARATPDAAALRSSTGLAALREGRRLDLNRAHAQELELLPGIGPRLAERIVVHRTEHGPFATLDQLTVVSGIGVRTVERLRPLVAAVPAQKRSKKSSAPAVTAK